MIASYIYDEQDQLVSISRGGQNYYYHFNGHGDVTKITDSSGQVVASYTYDAWGNITSSSGSFANSQPFRYAGYLYDSETGLYYLINRYYDPGIGRFISKDPRATFSPPDSLGANPYLYVRNNPVNRSDPDGLGPTGVVKGRVINTDGNPIVRATVRICNSIWGSYIQPDRGNVMGTDSNGDFRFTLIPDGIYTMYYDAVEYASQTQTGITVSGGGTTTTPTVIMSPAQAPAPQPPSGSTTQPAPSASQPAPTQPAPEPAKPQPLPPSPTRAGPFLKSSTLVLQDGFSFYTVVRWFYQISPGNFYIPEVTAIFSVPGLRIFASVIPQLDIYSSGPVISTPESSLIWSRMGQTYKFWPGIGEAEGRAVFYPKIYVPSWIRHTIRMSYTYYYLGVLGLEWDPVEQKAKLKPIEGVAWNYVYLP